MSILVSPQFILVLLVRMSSFTTPSIKDIFGTFENDTTMNNENNLDDSSSATNHKCYGASEEEMKTFEKVAFYSDVIVQTGIGSIGIVANCFAIPILCRYV